jgi:hypothetical protein
MRTRDRASSALGVGATEHGSVSVVIRLIVNMKVASVRYRRGGPRTVAFDHGVFHEAKGAGGTAHRGE